MYRILKRGIPVKVELEVRNRIGQQVEKAVNITGEIPGGDLKNEVVMIGAHFDTWHASPNASDNTSAGGCARGDADSQGSGAKPRRTIRMALWSGEEQGLWGSRAYVKQHFGNPNDSTAPKKPDYDRLFAYFDHSEPRISGGIYLQGNEAARSLLAAWMEPFRDMGMTVVESERGQHRSRVVGRGGPAGIPVSAGPGAGHWRDTNLDFYDTIQPEDSMKNAVIMASYAWHAAQSGVKMPRKAVR